jgi:hypothetical protein
VKFLIRVQKQNDWHRWSLEHLFQEACKNGNDAILREMLDVVRPLEKRMSVLLRRDILPARTDVSSPLIEACRVDAVEVVRTILTVSNSNSDGVNDSIVVDPTYTYVNI